MLSELQIENLAVIPGARIAFAPGLNVISGETGAGKTILAQAIALLLGTRADSGLIRPDASEATVEAVFHVAENWLGDLAGELDLPAGEELSVRRRLSRDGRSRAYVGGRTANLSVLEQLTGRLLAFSAQHEQRRLMMSSHQLEILDAYCGRLLLDMKDEYMMLFARWTEVIDALDGLSSNAEARTREAELLRFQLEEIESAGLSSGEEEELEEHRLRLQSARELKEASAAMAALLGATDAPDVNMMETLPQLRARLEALAGVDSGLDGMGERLSQIYFEMEDLGRTARDYSGTVESDPSLLAETEERLDLISRLKRKYGGSVKEVLEFAEQAGRQLAVASGTEQERSGLEEERQRLEAEMLELAQKLRVARTDAAGRLAEEAGRHLRDLAFGECGFEVRLTGNEGESSSMSADHLTRTGADTAEFFVRLNPGMPATPLKETASGGELSRIMLAVKCAVSSSAEAATLVFDEIDAGIGGETGAAVGAKLKRLSGSSQIICITHLPQIACFADAHFSVVKDMDDQADETVTQVNQLAEGEVIDELCRMMGSSPDDDKARAHAGSLLRKAGAR